LHLLSRSRRLRRSHEWSAGKAVTFIVTLAATRSVTLAAREAGMSRKSAYALKDRDPAFAAAWNAALKATEGDKVEEVEGPPVSLSQGDIRTRAASSISSNDPCQAARRLDELQRDLFFARLARLRADSPSLAHGSSAQ
jgi:hypothetical protein